MYFSFGSYSSTYHGVPYQAILIFWQLTYLLIINLVCIHSVDCIHFVYSIHIFFVYCLYDISVYSIRSVLGHLLSNIRIVATLLPCFIRRFPVYSMLVCSTVYMVYTDFIRIFSVYCRMCAVWVSNILLTIKQRIIYHKNIIFLWYCGVIFNFKDTDFKQN